MGEKKEEQRKPSFLQILREKHRKLGSDPKLQNLPFGSDADFDTILAYADNFPELIKKKCQDFKKKTKKLEKMDKQMKRIAAKGELLGQREQIRAKRQNIETDLSSLEDNIRTLIFKNKINQENKTKEKHNASLDARAFDDTDDFYDRAKVIKKRKKQIPKLATLAGSVQDLAALKLKKEEIIKKLETIDNEEEKKKLKQNLAQIKTRIFQQGLKFGVPLIKKKKKKSDDEEGFKKPVAKPVPAADADASEKKTMVFNIPSKEENTKKKQNRRSIAKKP